MIGVFLCVFEVCVQKFRLLSPSALADVTLGVRLPVGSNLFLQTTLQVVQSSWTFNTDYLMDYCQEIEIILAIMTNC